MDQVPESQKRLLEQAGVLYSLLGQVVWTIQHLEDALSHAIAIKNPAATTKHVGDKILNSNRELTLGNAVKLAKRDKIFSEALQQNLEDFLVERNWVIHKCMRESVDEMGGFLDEETLFLRIKDILQSAGSLKQAIEIDMFEFVTSKGRPDIKRRVADAYVAWLKNGS